MNDKKTVENIRRTRTRVEKLSEISGHSVDTRSGFCAVCGTPQDFLDRPCIPDNVDFLSWFKTRYDKIFLENTVLFQKLDELQPGDFVDLHVSRNRGTTTILTAWGFWASKVLRRNVVLMTTRAEKHVANKIKCRPKDLGNFTAVSYQSSLRGIRDTTFLIDNPINNDSILRQNTLARNVRWMRFAPGSSVLFTSSAYMDHFVRAMESL